MLMLKMLKMLMLKIINLYKYKLSVFGRDDTKQAKSLIFTVVPQLEQFPKVQKKKQKKTKKMLDVIRTYINSNYKLT